MSGPPLWVIERGDARVYLFGVGATLVAHLAFGLLADAVVTFDGDDGQFSYGLTDAAGHYTLQFDSVKQGVKTGKKTVRISTTRKILGALQSRYDIVIIGSGAALSFAGRGLL